MRALVGSLSWWWRARVPRRLASFAATEEASMIDLRIAARLTPSAARAAAYLAHADDEARHARMFARHAREWAEREGASAPAPLPADVEHLFETLGEARFLAFVHRGEARGRRDFERHRAHFARRGEDKTAALFDAILVDERRHEAYSRALLDEVAGSRRGARRALAYVTAWEAWRRWLRVGRAMTSALYALAASVLYLVAAPLGLALAARRAPARS